ncbi:sugar ABC transporter ATP-binding protein, partial [Kitasatospora sp. NPDC058263]
SGVVLKYVTAARDAGLGVVLITHNPHHAYLVGDHFTLLKRGRMAGSHPRAEIGLEELTTEMAGGSDLEELSHELARPGTDTREPRDTRDSRDPREERPQP